MANPGVAVATTATAGSFRRASERIQDEQHQAGPNSVWMAMENANATDSSSTITKRIRTTTDDSSCSMDYSQNHHPMGMDSSSGEQQQQPAAALPSPDQVLTEMILQSGATTHTQVVDFCLSSGIPISRMLRLDLMRKLAPPPSVPHPRAATTTNETTMPTQTQSASSMDMSA